MKDVAQVKAYSMVFLGLFCWLLIEQAIPTSDSLFGWPAWRGFVSWETGEQENENVLWGETCGFKRPWQYWGCPIVLAVCMVGLHCWKHKQNKILLLCHFFLPKLESVVISFLLWSLKSEPFGNPGAVTGFPFVVFLQSEGGGVFQTLEVTFLKKQEAPLPTYLCLSRFRAEWWKWSQCRRLQDVAGGQRTV